MSMFQLSIDDRYATILFNAPQRSNALSFEEYFELAALLRQTDAMPSVLVTVLTGTGRFFCAGVNVQTSFPVVEGEPERVVTSRRFAANLDLTDALMSHSKVLVCALNGGAIGAGAGFIGCCDFIYAVDDAFLMAPFTSIGVTAEFGSTVTFPQRMGINMAREALLLGKRLSAQELKSVGFVNRIYPNNANFLPSVMKDLKEDFEHLSPAAVIYTKQLLKRSLPDFDSVNARECLGGVHLFGSGVPQQSMDAIKNKTRRHKL